MAELNFKIHDLDRIPKAVLVSMEGAIDATTVVQFQSTLENLQLNGTNKFILDMEGIKYVNSTGLGSLVRLADQLESDGGGFALVKIHPKVKVVFDMLGLNAFFKIFNSMEEAEAYFVGGDGGAAPPPPGQQAGMPQTSQRQAPPMPGGQTGMRAPQLGQQGQAGTSQRQAVPGGPPQQQQQAQGQWQNTQARQAQFGQQQQPSGGGFPGGMGQQQRPGQTQMRSQNPADFGRQYQGFQPRAIQCENCGVTLKIQQVGTFKCSRCQTIFSVHPTGQVQFQLPQQQQQQYQQQAQQQPQQQGGGRQNPIRLSLNSTEECRDALLAFTGVIARRAGFNDQRHQAFQYCVNEIVLHITQMAYGNNPATSYAVVLASQGGEVSMQFVDRGRPLDPNNPQLFQNSRRYLSQFNLQQHPQGGNVTTVKMRAF